MRLAVYTDYTYRRVGGVVYAERAFALFLTHLATELESLVIAGKVDPAPGAARYELPASVEFAELPYYQSLARPAQALLAMGRSLGTFWRLLGDVDGVWLLGPHPLALAYAMLAFARRKPITLGVRQDFPRYVRARHPARRWMHVIADLLDGIWRLLARRLPVIVVGRALAAEYTSGRILEIAVSLVTEADLELGARANARAYDGSLLRVLTVGRLEEEKNPLLLADIIDRLRRSDPRWRLLVCGEGSLEGALRERLSELAVEPHVEMLGYVPHDRLGTIYRDSHALLHVSWTEGFPQVLLEAFAARLPVVATDVGGIRQGVGEAALLVEPGECEAAVSALGRVSGDSELRARLTAAGARIVAPKTLDTEARRVAAFLRSPA